MINVNFTLLVQLANFLILLVVLNFLLFRPILKVLDDREKLVRESAELKERLGTLAQENIQEYESKLHTAKQESMAMRSGHRSEAMALFREAVQNTKIENVGELDKARAALAAEAESSRKVLKAEAEGLAGRIASKLMGRAVGGGS